ncbi:MAG: hypothetical protein N2255_03670 [Kiritimatiellae bacterium]|nr:hypothetical protein [Kiritimatiellia bacterium]
MLPTSAAFTLPAPSTSVFRRATEGYGLKTTKAGYLGIRRWAGDPVGAGETVAVVRSIETFEPLERLESPVAGAVSCAGHPAGEALVEPGETVAVVKPVTEIGRM